MKHKTCLEFVIDYDIENTLGDKGNYTYKDSTSVAFGFFVLG